MTEVIMPKMGDGMEEGTLLEWLKKDGEAVKAGESIANIQTDKATLEMPADASGTLAGILVKEGETVPVGKPIALLLAPGESVPAGWASGGSATSPLPSAGEPPDPAELARETKSGGQAEGAVDQPSPPQSEIRNPISPLVAAAQAASASPQPTSSQSTATPPVSVSSVPSVVSSPTTGSPNLQTSELRTRASPLAKRVAKELGVSLTGVKGTGPGGRIVEKDVRSAAATSIPQSEIRIPQSEVDTPVPLSKIRQITAKVTASSKQQVPHFYVTVEVDVERIMDLREQFEADGVPKPSINDFVIRACALGLRDMPIVNSSYQGDHVLQHGRVNIGMAVALEDGLTLPVIHDADLLALTQIAPISKDLAQKAHANRLHPDELSGATFSISNMGMLNVDDFSAIIVQPNSAIVAVSTVRKVVVPVDDYPPPQMVRFGEGGRGERSDWLVPPQPEVRNPQFVVRRRMNMTGSFDHRVVDGAVGARFMNVLRDYLQSPTRLLS